ncbi:MULTISPECIES: glycosyltransferase family 2 protein [unclassified Paenibacillus]|uniref:glycosyltransferase family 2 protein n=1 Tax=unclassified Paenibacillus TaxID=185978 RepID=UPI0030F93BAA
MVVFTPDLVNLISAGIVLYNPDISRLQENMNAIHPQVDYLILIDNASENINEIESVTRDFEKVILLKNDKNYGIATALNQIVQYSSSKFSEWVLLLDQDSVVPKNMIEQFSKYRTIDSVGIITPRIVDRNYLEEVKNDSETAYIEKCITSGSFINISLFKKLGGFDEKMFIDFVDFEYCARVRKANYKILRINSIVLLHQLGSMKVYRILGKTIRVTNHSSLRHYYYTRNTVYYYKKHKDFLKKTYPGLTTLKKVAKILAFENKKTEKIKCVFKGLIDGAKMV